MTDNLGKDGAFSPNGDNESSSDYLARAAQACEAGDMVLGMHLYLTAYERAVVDPDIPDGMALAGLHEAWSLACSLKERSIAEYVFEKLEPFLTVDEIPEYANQLQNLALDRLEEYGFSREELADMAEMISQDLADGTASVVKVESISVPAVTPPAQDAPQAPEAEQEESVSASDQQDADEEPQEKGKPNKVGLGVAAADDFNPYDIYEDSSVGKSYHCATTDGSGAYVFTRDENRAAKSQESGARQRQESADDDPANAWGAVQNAQAPIVQPQQENQESAESPTALAPAAETRPASPEVPKAPKAPEAAPNVFKYQNLVGYDKVVAVMRDLGVGLQRDRGFTNFVSMMNARHGLDRMPSLDTILFRAPVIEDAARFMEATIGEVGLPVLRMSMEEGIQGSPLLCVSVQGNSRPRMNHAHNSFEGPGILVIEDLDMWVFPAMPEGLEGLGGLVMANISRGAREAVNLIRSAVEDPRVVVLATATTEGAVDPFFYDLLEPMTIIDIGYPTEAERRSIWTEILNDHPSMRAVKVADLTRLSAGLARNDLYLAAREAIEEAYKMGLTHRMYIPVSEQNIFDKLAACQPLDSEEYQEIEDAVIRAFKDELEHLDDLLDASSD